MEQKLMKKFAAVVGIVGLMFMGVNVDTLFDDDDTMFIQAPGRQP